MPGTQRESRRCARPSGHSRQDRDCDSARREMQKPTTRKLHALPGLAAELIRSNPDVLVTHGTPGTLAAKEATTTIPIVMAIIGDAVASGAVASEARPGGM